MVGVDARHCYRRFALWTAVVCCGCGRQGDSGIVITNPHRQSPPLLASEIQAAPRPADLLDRDYVLHNRSPAPQTVRLVGTSCSCYGVMLDGQPWEKGSTVTVPPGEQRLLTFDVRPPRQSGEKSWSVRIASGANGEREHVLSLSARVVRDFVLDPEVVFVSLPADSQRGQRGDDDRQMGNGLIADRRHRIVIRHRWRVRNAPEEPLMITGLPEGIVSTRPERIGEPGIVAPGLQEQEWECELKIDASRISSSIETPKSVYGFRVFAGDPTRNAPGESGRIVLDVLSGIRAPSVVHWGRLAQDVSRHRRIVLAATDQQPFRIERARLRIRGREFPIEQQNAGTPPNLRSEPALATLGLSSPQLDLTVELDAHSRTTRHFASLELTPRSAGPVNATLILETDHPVTSTIEVELRSISFESPSNSEAAGG